MPKIWRTWITLRDGKRIYASDYGKRAFCFETDDENHRQKKEPVVCETTDPTAY